ENEIPDDIIDDVHLQDSRNMDLLPDSSIHLVVTSPPYVAHKEYEEDWTLDEYLQLIRDVFDEAYTKLVPGGRVCINIANLGRSPYIPLNSFIIQTMLDIGYLMRGEIIWDKGASVGTSTAWGSWKSASNPVLRDEHEYIMVFSKETFQLESDGEDTISKEEFLDFSKSIWSFPTASAKEVGHPAPFPKELPYRAIQLFTKKQDVVLDPFIGSGTTGIAALESQRHFVGFDNEEEYIDLAKSRIDEHRSQKNLEDFL
ncbi:MAG: site-specific DNA-methyltransferase, partial [Halobacteriaceae archaeon]